MPNVSFVKYELKKYLGQYTLIDDCIEGERAVKDRRTAYLPQPNAADTSDENLARYDAYLKRAVFYNVTSRTLRGMLGQVFAKDSEIELPQDLEMLETDANGGGLTLEQSAKRALANVLAKGRCGLFVDYPDTEGVVSRADMDSGIVRPTIKNYKPEEIINWRIAEIGAKQVLSLVVIKEHYDCKDDGFELRQGTQYRVLRLVEDTNANADTVEDISQADEQPRAYYYCVEIYQAVEGNWQRNGIYYPKDSRGQFLTEIPFMFIGSENNDVHIDIPPMYDIASLNIAHYRNSADYEESSFMVGQPTPWFGGLTQDWVKNVMGGVVQLGARAAVALPTDATAGLLQPEPNSMPFEAMEHKERQMVALGARLVEQQSVQRTATEARMDETSELSILASSAQNVSQAYLWALKTCQLFTGGSGEIVFNLNDDFELASMSPQERQQLVSEWQEGLISFPELRSAYKRIGLATDDIQEPQRQNENQPAGSASPNQR